MMINISFRNPSEAQRTLCHLKDLLQIFGKVTEADLYYWLSYDELTPKRRNIDNWGWLDLSDAKVKRGKDGNRVYLELPDSKRLV